MSARPRMRPWLRALGGQLGDQWERNRRDTLFLMLPVLLAVLPHFSHMPWWVSAGFLMLFCWRLGLLFSGRWLPRASVRWVGALAATAAVWAHYDKLVGSEPGVALLILFLGLKLMEVQARRDLFAVIFLSMFLLLAAFLKSQSIGTAVLVLTGFAGLLTAMLTMQYRQHEAPVGQRLRTVAVLLLQALPVAVIVFLLFPRPAGTLWGFGSDGQRARTGLSESMTPGAISELGESTEIAFRVRFDAELPSTATLYWRGPVFGRFDGATWRSLELPARPPARVFYRSDSRVGYEITQEPSTRTWLFPLEMPVTLSLPEGLQARLRPDLQLVASRPLDGRLRYRVESGIDWQAGLDDDPDSLQRWLELPAGFNPETLALARSWRGGSAAPEARLPLPDGPTARRAIDQALTMFREQPFSYTLRPPPVGRNSVDDFLFDTRSGFCEHFAAAFVVLMRAYGNPARIVTGYQGGERNPVDGWWLVRQADAHAWAEVWIAGQGWQRIDPTAAVAPGRITRGERLMPEHGGLPGFDLALPLLKTLRLRIDAIGNAWNQWLLSYDQSRQQRLLQRIGLPGHDWRTMAGLLAFCLAVAVTAIALWTLVPRRSRDPVERAWQAFCDKLASLAPARRPHETASDYLRRIEPLLAPEQAAEAHRIAGLYNRLRFGKDGTGKSGGERVRHLQRCIRKFRL
ncbi:MAG: DUF3488 and transglutaminase-like domain-containing protein [Burkholderiaceae bacterium]